MKLFYFSLSLFLTTITLLSCNHLTIQSDQSNKMESSSNNEGLTAMDKDKMKDDSVQVTIQIEKLSNKLYQVSIQMNLFGDTWIVSALEKTFPYGEMSIEFDKNKNIALIDPIVETPNSIEKNDPNWKAPYRVIKGETIISQKIKRLTTEDFEVEGHVFFVLEPICTPNYINFKISNNAGQLSIQQIE